MTLKDIEELLKKQLRPLQETIAATRGAVKEIKSDVTSLKLDYHGIRRELDEINDKVGALIVDASDIKDEVKALGDQIDANVDTTKREIKEMKEHLGI